MIEIFIISYLNSIFYISSGLFFAKKILDIKIADEQLNIFKFVLYGGIFIAFLGLLLNFFISLGKNINTILLIISFVYLFTVEKKVIKKVLLYSLLIGFACCILIIYENTYRPDAGLYHLPYISVLNTEKIIIGLSNIHFRFGHTSIVQYLSAINYNWIFNNNAVVLPTGVIYFGFLFYLIYEIKNTKDKNLLLFNFLLFSYLCLKLNRFSDFGNDAPAHIYYFFLTSLALNNYYNLNKNKMSEIIVLSAYIVFNKITLFLGSLISLIFLFYKKNVFYFKIKPIIFISLFTLLFFLKNFLVSGCIAFPIEKTCNKNILWFDNGIKGNSIAKITMLENEAWTKGWSDQKENVKSYEVYLSNYNWIKIWVKNHGKRTLNKLLPFLIFTIFVFFIVLNIKNQSNYKKNEFKEINQKKIFYIFLILNFVGVVFWFLKFPVFRYGYSYIILTLIFIVLICLFKKVQMINIEIMKKYLSFFIIFLFFVLITKNLLRIKNNFGVEYYNAPWPKIFSYSKKNTKQQYEEIKKDNKLLFYFSKNGLCMYGPAPCSHYINERLNRKKKFGYNIYWINN